MRVLTILALLITLFPKQNLQAEPSSDSEPDQVIKPAVSLSGLKRIYDNIDIVTNNIKDAQANLLTCEKNRTIVIAELQELDKFEREQVGLIKSYEAYLKKAEEQLSKNAQGTEALEKFEQQNKDKLKASSGKDQIELATKLTTAKQDLEARQKWKADANEKIAKVKKLLVGAKTNLKEIQSRRDPLKAQLSSWASKQDEYKGLIRDYSEKKAQLERLAELSKNEPSTAAQ